MSESSPLEQAVTASVCRLCHVRPSIEHSHVIPALVFRALKADSPTGFFRNPNRPNRRLQDGDTQPLLCSECEGLFSVAEREFARRVFEPFHWKDVDRFSYGPWLHFFMTSLAWRTLILDIPSIEAAADVPAAIKRELSTSASIIEAYLLGSSQLGSTLRNHALVFTGARSASRDLASIGPNVMLRRSAFGYTVISKIHGYAAVIHNLAGFICVLVIKGNPRDQWRNTKINPVGGTVVPPQSVDSWIMHDLMEFLIEAHDAKKRNLSDVQRQKTIAAMQRRPNVPSLRFRAMDEAIIFDE